MVTRFHVVALRCGKDKAFVNVSASCTYLAVLNITRGMFFHICFSEELTGQMLTWLNFSDPVWDPDNQEKYYDTGVKKERSRD